MTRLPASDMEHTFLARSILPASGDGQAHAAAKTKRGVVDGRSKMVRDQRADSESRGTEILATHLVVCQLEDYEAPGSLITVWPGTPGEHEGQVISAFYGDHSKAPKHAEMWIE
jgi:hypothetical protein